MGTRRASIHPAAQLTDLRKQWPARLQAMAGRHENPYWNRECGEILLKVEILIASEENIKFSVGS